jgi:hypothetical protein
LYLAALSSQIFALLTDTGTIFINEPLAELTPQIRATALQDKITSKHCRSYSRPQHTRAAAQYA